MRSVILSKILKPHYQEIFLFSTPIILSMMMLNFMGLVDGALVGHLGTEALAAYGLAFFIHFIHAGILMGLATAVQSLTANAIGVGNKKEAAIPLNAALIASIVFGVALSFLANQYKDILLAFMTKNQNVQHLASKYLHMRFFGVFAVGITYSFRGYWNGIGRPSTYLFIMGFTYLINAFISYSVVFGKFGFPQLGLPGVALSSIVATILAALLNFIWAFVSTKEFGFGTDYFNKIVWKNLLKQSVPSGMTQFLFALGYAVFFAIIGKLGANELAAANILVTFSLFFIYPGMAMGMTAATYVGRSLGAQEWQKSYYWTNKITIYSVVLFAVISIPFIIWNEEILSFFIKSSDVLHLAKLPYIIFLTTLVIEISGQIYTFAFLGAGKPKIILLVTTAIQWIGIIPFSYYLGHDLLTIWGINIGFRCLQTFILFYCWNKDRNLIPYSLSPL